MQQRLQSTSKLYYKWCALEQLKFPRKSENKTMLWMKRAKNKEKFAWMKMNQYLKFLRFEMYCAIGVKKLLVLVTFVTLLAVKHFYILFSICCVILCVCCYAPCLFGLFDLHASDPWLDFCAGNHSTVLAVVIMLNVNRWKYCSKMQFIWCIELLNTLPEKWATAHIYVQWNEYYHILSMIR